MCNIYIYTYVPYGILSLVPKTYASLEASICQAIRGQKARGQSPNFGLSDVNVGGIID